MKKTIIVDTNVLLTDPDSLYAFDDNEVVIPFTVIEELDRIKNRPNEVGANAREIARRLGQLISANPRALKEGIELKNGGTLRIVAKSDFKSLEIESLSNEWDSENKDNQILEVCLGLAAANKKLGKPEPILISRDTLLRVKCDFLKILCEDYKEDSVVESTNQIYTGGVEIKVPSEILQKYWECSENNTEFFVDLQKYTTQTLFPNQFIIFEDENNIYNVPTEAHARYISPDEPLHIVRNKTSPVFGNLIPRNREQQFAIDLLYDEKIKLVTLIGRSGGGKTLCALAAALDQVLSKKRYKNIMVCKPIVSVGNEIGHLPGEKSEKLEPWIAPIKDNLRFLLSPNTNGTKKNKPSETYFQDLFENGTIEVEAISYLRGRSLNDTFIIIDEGQNLSNHEMKTILTRVGENTKIVVTGDTEQIDAFYLNSTSNGLSVAVEKFKPYAITAHISLVRGERSELATLASTVLV